MRHSSYEGGSDGGAAWGTLSHDTLQWQNLAVELGGTVEAWGIQAKFPESGPCSGVIHPPPRRELARSPRAPGAASVSFPTHPLARRMSL